MTRLTVHRFCGVDKRSCTRRRSAPARTHQRVRLQPGSPAAPEGDRLPLLPSGPDGVHGPPLRGTRLSTSDAVVVGERCCPRPGVQLRYSGLRIQGTASSPPSTTGRDGRSGGWIGQLVGGGEGGIRTLDGLPRTAFPVPRHRPLGDLSTGCGVAEREGFEPSVLFAHRFSRAAPSTTRTPLRAGASLAHSPRVGEAAIRPMRRLVPGAEPRSRARQRRPTADAAWRRRVQG